jgi:hypothetical protein
MNKFIIKFVEKNKFFAFLFVKGVIRIQYFLAEVPLIRVTRRIVDYMNADFVLTTHSWCVRGGVKRPAFSVILDPGYGGIVGRSKAGYFSSSTILQPFAPQTRAQKKIIFSVFNDQMRTILQEVYGIVKIRFCFPYAYSGNFYLPTSKRNGKIRNN